MRSRILWCVAFAICFSSLLLAPSTRAFATWNVAFQVVIFLVSANVPAWFNNRLSYVDFAWPAGLFAIGLQLLLGSGPLTPVAFAVGTFYSVVGLRMAVWGAQIYRGLEGELPRYQYQRRRWERAGLTNERLSVQYEISVQAMANASFLALPAAIASTSGSRSLNAFEVAAVIIWCVSFALESLSDWQKKRFLGSYFKGYANDNSGVCDVGLWGYSRHPNYFFQWVQWIALVALALPSAYELRASISFPIVVLLGVELLWITRMMYSTMVYYTGAVPAEYYSVRKRPAYVVYQARVNRFFPGPKRKTAKNA